MKTVIILLSDKRSGSTMFQDAICANPTVQTLRYSPHTYLESHHWLKGAVLLGVHPSLFSNGKTYKNYGSRKSARTYLVDELKGNLPDYSIPKDNKQLVFEGWEALCDRYAQPIFFEKSPQHLSNWAALSLLLEWAQRTSRFKVKFIGLVRNPLSVQYSAFKLFRTIPEKRQYSWLNTQRNLLAFWHLIGKENFYLVRYEDVVNDAQTEMAKICDYIGIEYFPEMAHKIHGESKSKWHEDEYFNFSLDRSIIQLARAFGYTDENLVNTNFKSLNRWKRFVWRLKTRLLRLKNKILNRVIVPFVIKFRLRSVKDFFSN